jgi:hypothetical protein
MRKLLLASVAALALTGCNSKASNSASLCSSPDTLTLLQSLIQKNIVDVTNIVLPDDPYTLEDMKKADIILVDETPHKTTCKILLRMDNKANPASPNDQKEQSDDTDWITYSVQKTDNNDKLYVDLYLTAQMKEGLEGIKAAVALKEWAKKADAEAAAQKAAADAKEKAAHTIDTSASCDGLKAGINKQTAINNFPQLSLAATDVSTISPGVCSVYMARSRRQIVGLPPYHSVYVYSFSQTTYNMTLGGPKIAKEDQWLSNPLDGQSVPEGMQHDSNTGYFSDENLLETGTKTDLTPLEQLRSGMNADGTPSPTAGGNGGGDMTSGAARARAPRPPIRPKPRIQTNDAAGLY